MSYPLENILLPMGAKEVKDEKKMDALWDDGNYVAEEKYDGSRYLSVGGRFFSRRVSVKDGFPVEKTDNVPHLTSILNKYPNLILDGEVYYEGMSSNDVTSIMGALPEKAIERQKERGFLKYVVFDILRDFNGNWLVDKTWKERRKLLEMAVGLIKIDLLKENNKAFDKIDVSQVVVYDKREFYNEIMARGGEGIILKNVNAKYVPDKKPSWNWVKVKKHITDDVVIMGFKPPVRVYDGKELDTWQYWENEHGIKFTRADLKPGEGIIGTDTPVTKFYFYDWIGAVTFGKYYLAGETEDGTPCYGLNELGFCSGLTDEMRKDMSENPEKYIGDCMEIGAMEQTKDGFYRHPVFNRMRPDKSPSDCRIGEQ